MAVNDGESFGDPVTLNDTDKVIPHSSSRSSISAIISESEQSPVEQDIPLPGGFANTLQFWKVAVMSVLLGLVVGSLAICFLNVSEETMKQWTNIDNLKSNPSAFDLYSGQQWWIAVPTGAGLVIGLIRYMAAYPDNIDGMFKEIQTVHVDYEWCPYTYVISLISLSCGACLGPEAGLGNVGGGVGCFITRKDFGYVHIPKDYKKLVVLSGFAAAMGALFPSPILAVMLIFELGPNPPRQLIECVTMTGICAVASFAISYTIVSGTWLDHVSQTLFKIDAVWDFSLDNLGVSFVVGVISAAIGLCICIVIGIGRAAFGTLRKLLEFNKLWYNVIPPTLGGLLIGITNYCLPLTLGSGSVLFNAITDQYFAGNIPNSNMIGSIFARMALLSISMNCGFIGGFCYPMITIGLMAALIASNMYPSIPIGLFLACFMASITASLAPLMYTFTVLFALIFSLGPYQATCVFVSVLTSYTLVSGSGLLLTLQKKAAEKAAADEAVRNLKGSLATSEENYVHAKGLSSSASVSVEPTKM